MYERFVAELARRAAALRIGRGDELETQVGPLIAEDERARIEALLGEALDRGAEVCTGGRRPSLDLPGWFYEPTVVTGAELRDEEAFGPLVTVMPFAGEDQAVELANALGSASAQASGRPTSCVRDASPAGSKRAWSGRTTTPTRTAWRCAVGRAQGFGLGRRTRSTGSTSS